ncbi:cold-shock protein [Mucilaginibacter sp. UR6-11]|uniref:cold-shock protein n=1 Tax=Mucilaginibacter sp. UR6-11 TaxID=1435644 RepID=UPI001E4288FF|nr:cold shock domain-containing protein [Mucilaginibacter sp. UR6-11]MCC8426332.1 cold shock domain-containing protein [Mucilaginibacter sp. UR6-11]
MAKSTATFSKKEKEKKRLKKSQDKREKAEQRKSTFVKGKTLEDMMAYIDEHGNITSTPPDPARKLKVNSADIQIAVPKQEDIVMEIVRTGIVGFFNEAKGYGFIKDLQTQESIFVHVNNLTEPIKENNKVTFEIEPGLKGPTAVKVKLSN